MSSPDHSKTGLSHEPKAYSKIRTRISQSEQQAVAALKELQLRVSTSYVKAQIQGALRQHLQSLNDEWAQISHQWKYSMVKTLERYPLPAAVIGLGLICFQKISANGKKEPSGSEEYDITVRQEKDFTKRPFVEHQVNNLQMEEPPQQAAYSTWEKDQAAQQVRQWKEPSEPKKEKSTASLHQQLVFARGAFVHRVQEHPLAIGAIMLTVGAAVAAALPRSRKENQWMGEKRDKLVEAAKVQLHSTLKEVKGETKKAFWNLLNQENHRAPIDNPTIRERKIT